MNIKQDAQAGAVAGTQVLAEEVIGSDKFAGMGGSFVLDPGTGKRMPTAETAEHLARVFPAAEEVQSPEGEEVAVTNE